MPQAAADSRDSGPGDQANLVAAFQAWTLDKARPLAEYPVARGDLEADDRSAVEALVTRHLKKHDGSTEKSLAAIPAGPSTRRRAMALRKGGLPNDWFLLAMALARKGEKQKAVEWYEKAVEERRRLKMTVDDVFLLCSEAARLLGLPAPPSEVSAVPK